MRINSIICILENISVLLCHPSAQLDQLDQEARRFPAESKGVIIRPPQLLKMKWMSKELADESIKRILLTIKFFSNVPLLFWPTRVHWQQRTVKTPLTQLMNEFVLMLTTRDKKKGGSEYELCSNSEDLAKTSNSLYLIMRYKKGVM